MTGDIRFLPVAEADFEALAAIRIEAMRESLERIGRFDPERARERLRNGFSPAYTRHIVFEGERAGFIAVKPDGNGLLLDHLYLLPRHQGRGIGGSVLESLLREADRAGLSIKVGALRGSASNAFYLRHGFEPDGEGPWDLYYVRKAGAAGEGPGSFPILIPRTP